MFCDLGGLFCYFCLCLELVTATLIYFIVYNYVLVCYGMIFVALNLRFCCVCFTCLWVGVYVVLMFDTMGVYGFDVLVV